MKKQYIFLFACILSLCSCKPYYLVQNFEEETDTHKTIAVLPFEIQVFGQYQKGLTSDEKLELQEQESKAFQVSYYQQILNSTRRGNRAMRVKMQHYSKTLHVLKENNISIADSWEMTPEHLTQILGVDAVVRGRIEKEKYFSDGLSAGIEVGSILLGELGVNRAPIPSRNNKNIQADYSLVNGLDGSVLWAINYQWQADWRQQSDQIVDEINRRSSRFFPYRQKKD